MSLSTQSYFQNNIHKLSVQLITTLPISVDFLLTSLDKNEEILGVRIIDKDPNTSKVVPTTNKSRKWILLFSNTKTPKTLLKKQREFYPYTTDKNEQKFITFFFIKTNFFPVYFGFTQVACFLMNKISPDFGLELNCKRFTRHLKTNEKSTIKFMVTNKSKNSIFRLQRLHVATLRQLSSIDKLSNNRPNKNINRNRDLRLGESFSQSFEFQSDLIGNHLFSITADFRNLRNPDHILSLSSVVFITVSLPSDHILKSKQLSPWIEPIRDTMDRSEIVTPSLLGENQKLFDQLQTISPNNLIVNAEERWKLDPDLELKIFNEREVNFMPWNTIDNYVDRYHQLLFIEEAQQRANLSFLNHKNDLIPVYDPEIELIDGECLVKIYLSGIANIRPFLELGDHLSAFLEKNRVKFRGVIKKLKSDHIIVSFSTDIESFLLKNIQFNVQFLVPRDFFIRLHEAIHSLKTPLDQSDQSDASDPSDQSDRSSTAVCKFIKVKSKEPTKPELIPHFDSINNLPVFDLHMSKDQKKALKSIVCFQHCNLPYILTGPFGTGKTRTLIEATKEIAAIKSFDDKTKILISTKTNSAANEIFGKLIGDKEFAKYGKNCFRIFSEKMNIKTIISNRKISEDQVIKHTNFDDEEGCFRSITLKDIEKKTILITTCNYSFILKEFEKEISFSHIIIDEAAQIMEPEALVPLSLSSSKTSVILSGDPEQLGPRIYSPIALEHKLGESLLERLLREYSDCFYNSFDHTHKRLKCNFRICESLLGVTKNLAYPDASSKANLPFDFLTLPELKSAKSPVIFHSVEGKDVKDDEIPSFFNNAEIYCIVQTINLLIANHNVDPMKIAVVSEFDSQNRRIRSSLREIGLTEITVCTPYAIQGLEFEVVLVSTVRSNLDFHVYDQHFDLGFGNKKSLVTTLSRASSMLIIVGNINVFAYKYEKLMIFIKENGIIIGKEPNQKIVSELRTRAKKFPSSAPLTLSSLLTRS